MKTSDSYIKSRYQQHEQRGQRSPMANQASKWVFALVIVYMLSVGLFGCHPSSTAKQTEKQSTRSPVKTTKAQKTYSDIPTAFPNLYKLEPDSGLRNIYDESKVISWDEAGNYVCQAITVEGDVDSVVHSTSSNGSPYFYSFGGGTYEGFAVVI